MAESPRAIIPQAQFLALPHKFRAYVAGYGAGKTHGGCMAVCRHVWEWPKINSGYFAPTYSQIRDIFYPTMEEVAFSFGLKTDIKESNKEVHFSSGGRYRSTTICRSMEKPGSIVGFKIGHAMVDELDTMPTNKAENAWRKIIARMRYNVPGLRNGIDVTTTPEGFKFTYKKFVLEKSESYGIVHASTYDNEIHLPADYIPSLLETYPEALISAYLNGQFTNLTSGTVYKNYDRKLHDTARTIKPGEVLYIGQDFNVDNMHSAICVCDGGGFECIDQLVGILDTPALIKTISSKFPNHEIHIYPDSSAGSRKTVNASTSDIALLRQAGYKIRTNTRNPAVKDRILSMNKAFEKGLLRVSTTKAKNFAEALEKQAYDANGEPDKKSGYDHPNDALGYLICYELPVVKPMVSTSIRMGH